MPTQPMHTYCAMCVSRLGMSLIAGSVYAENNAFEFRNEVKQGEQRPGFTTKVMVKTDTFTVGAVAVKLVDFAQPPFDPNKMEWIK